LFHAWETRRRSIFHAESLFKRCTSVRFLNFR
jgi:hypothetical protein